jgi:hypothetical protein
MPRTRDNRCSHITADGRRCRLNRAHGHSALCATHSRLVHTLADRASQSPEAAAQVAQTLGSGLPLNNQTAVNDAISRLFYLRARKLVSARDTSILAYLLQLSLQTLNGAHHEFTRLYRWADWDKILDRAIQRSCNSDLPAPDFGRLPLRRRRRSGKLPETRREFAEQVLTEFALDHGLLEDPDEDEGDAQNNASEESELAENV